MSNIQYPMSNYITYFECPMSNVQLYYLFECPISNVQLYYIFWMFNVQCTTILHISNVQCPISNVQLYYIFWMSNVQNPTIVTYLNVQSSMCNYIKYFETPISNIRLGLPCSSKVSWFTSPPPLSKRISY